MTYSGASNPKATPIPALAPAWQAAIATHNSADAVAICAAYATYAPVIGYDPNLAVAQAVQETGWFTSPAWLNRRNPAGLGITGASVAGPNFGTVARGVQAHLALLNCYYGDGSDPWGVLTSVGYGGFTLGKHVLSDMNGVWAVPGDGYGDTIASIANGVVGATPPPPPSAVTGSAIIAAARQQIGKDWWNGEDGNPPHPSAFWCEAFAEYVPRSLGLTEARIDTAIDAGNAHTLTTSWPPANGAWVFLGAAFYYQGHVGFWDAAQGQLLCTLTSPAPNGTVGYMTVGPTTPGLMGWCLPDGAALDPPPDPFLHLNGHLIGGGFKNFYLAIPEAIRLQDIGLPTSDEQTEQVTDPAADGVDAHAVTRDRTVQHFERGILIYQPEEPPAWQVVRAMETQIISITTLTQGKG